VHKLVSFPVSQFRASPPRFPVRFWDLSPKARKSLCEAFPQADGLSVGLKGLSGPLRVPLLLSDPRATAKESTVERDYPKFVARTKPTIVSIVGLSVQPPHQRLAAGNYFEPLKALWPCEQSRFLTGP
jgi:hypothetical protein